MIKCDKYTDMVSAYADGELTRTQALDLEEHLKSCGSCRSLLETYREITASVNDEMQPVPETLLKGVMGQIGSEPAFSGSSSGKKNPRSPVLTRYLPLAACLVAALLVWRAYPALFGSKGSEANMPSFTRSSHDSAPAAAPGGGASGSSVAGAPDIGSGDEPAPEIINSVAGGEAIYGDEADNGTYTDRLSDDGISSGNNSGGIENEEQGIIAESSLPGPAGIPPAAGAESAPGARGQDARQTAPWILLKDESLMQTLSSTDKQFAGDYLEGASHWITITGALPEYLSGLGPDGAGSVLGWDAAYIIPSGDVLDLVNNASKTGEQNPEVKIEIEFVKNPDAPDSGYAVVLYSAGE